MSPVRSQAWSLWDVKFFQSLNGFEGSPDGDEFLDGSFGDPEVEESGSCLREGGWKYGWMIVVEERRVVTFAGIISTHIRDRCGTVLVKIERVVPILVT
jgi:hypothetical protein